MTTDARKLIELADKIEKRAHEYGGEVVDFGRAWAKDIRTLANAEHERRANETYLSLPKVANAEPRKAVIVGIPTTEAEPVKVPKNKKRCECQYDHVGNLQVLCKVCREPVKLAPPAPEESQ